jgi:hypothetical protein
MISSESIAAFCIPLVNTAATCLALACRPRIRAWVVIDVVVRQQLVERVSVAALPHLGVVALEKLAGRFGGGHVICPVSVQSPFCWVCCFPDTPAAIPPDHLTHKRTLM